MPVSPTPDEAYYWEIAQAYQQAELQVLGQIRDRLDRGERLSDIDWATSRLAEVQTMRRDATQVLARVNRSMASKINGAFGNAYKDGGVAALKDAAAYLPDKPSAVSSATRQAVVRALADRTREGLAGVMPNLLRKMEDDYREVVRSVVSASAAGGVDRRKATTQALQTLLGKGLKTGPDGRMSLPDYVQMSVRTGTANAAIQGHLDTLAVNGMDLVYIQPGPRHCDRCDEWANVPLWRASGSAGPVTVESVVSDRPVRVNVKGSLDQAKAAGWGHPNCRCNVGAYLPGVTEKTLPTPRPKWDQDGYENQQKQREIERHIREWKTREALSSDPAERAKAAAKVAQWQEIQRAHMKAHPELKRQYKREQPSTVQPPNASPRPPRAPRSPSGTPAGTRTAPEPARASEGLSDAARARNAEVMYGTGSPQHLKALGKPPTTKPVRVDKAPAVSPKQFALSDEANRLAAVREVYEGKDYNGFQVKVHEVKKKGGQDSAVTLHLYKDGKRAGTVERTFQYLGGSRGFGVTHDLMLVDRQYRGQGFSTAFSKFSEDWYKANGVNQIRVHAALDNGGYTWAKAGYKWDLDSYGGGIIKPSSVTLKMRQALDAHETMAEIDPKFRRTDEEIRLLRKWLDQFESADGSDWPDPSEIANSTVGKDVLSGADWFGLKRP
ncbi:capsid maturation protease [Microbacterium phage Jera]